MRITSELDGVELCEEKKIEIVMGNDRRTELLAFQQRAYVVLCKLLFSSDRSNFVCQTQGEYLMSNFYHKLYRPGPDLQGFQVLTKLNIHLSVEFRECVVNKTLSSLKRSEFRNNGQLLLHRLV